MNQHDHINTVPIAVNCILSRLRTEYANRLGYCSKDGLFKFSTDYLQGFEDAIYAVEDEYKKMMEGNRK